MKRRPDTRPDTGGQATDLLDLLLAATNDGYVDWDLVAGKVLYSPRWKTLFGYEPDELEDHPDLWREMSHPEDLRRADELFLDHLEGLWPLCHRWRMRHRNGDWRWVLCRAASIRDGKNRPVRVVSVYTDVTEQVRAEERYRALANGTPDTILRIRLDGLILDEKPSATPLSLIDDSDMSRMLLECTTNASWARKALHAVRAAIGSGEAVIFEDGTVTPGPYLETRVVKSADDEAVCVVRDITTRKQTEQALAEELERGSPAQQELIQASGHTGNTDVASSVLHIFADMIGSIDVAATAAAKVLAATSISKEEHASLRREILAIQRHIEHLEELVNLRQGTGTLGGKTAPDATTLEPGATTGASPNSGE